MIAASFPMRGLPSAACCLLALGWGAACASGSPSTERRVELLSPPEGGEVQGTVILRARVTPHQSANRLVFAVDGATVAQWDGAFPGPEMSIDWDTTAVANGIHEVTATVRWNDGQELRSGHLVVVANASSGIRIAEPLGEIFREDPSFTAVVELDDARDVERLRLSVDGETVQTIEPVVRERFVLEVSTEMLGLMPERETLELRATAERTDGLVLEARRALRVVSRQLWRFETLGAVWVPPEPLGDGAVAVLTDQGTLHVVEGDGTERCSVRADGERGIGAPRALPGTSLIAWGTTRALRITDASDCSERYRDALAGEFSSRPLARADGSVAAVTVTGTLLLVRPDGSGRQTVDLSASVSGGSALEVWSAPVEAGDGTVFVAGQLGSGGVLFAVAPDGSVRSEALTSGVRGGLLSWNGSLYFGGATDGSTYAYGLDLRRRWVAPGADAAEVKVTPAPLAGALVTGNGVATVLGLDPADGRERWRYDAGLGASAALPILGAAGFRSDEAGNHVAFGDALGTLHVLGPEGRLVFRAQVADGSMGRGIVAAPAIDEDRLYVGLEEQALLAFRLR